MSNLPESEDFAEGIYQIETSDRVLGGPGGIANKQAEQLGNRTAWLKTALAKVIDGATAVGKATHLATSRTLRFKGAASGSGTYDGSADTDITLTLTDSGIAAGAYTRVVFNVKGIAVSGSNPDTLAGHGITDTYRAVDIDSKLDGKVNGDWVDTIGFASDNIAQPYVRQKSTGTNILLAAAHHSHSFSSLTGVPTTLAGHGIYDAFTKTQVEALLDGKVAQLINAAPGALDTIGELATALNNNPNFATDVINGLAGKANKGTTLKDYGILDSYRNVDVDWRLDAKANWGTTLADYRISDCYRAVDVDYKLVFKADKASTAAGYGLTDVHTLTSFMKPTAAQWVLLSGAAVIPAGGTWAYFVVSYNTVGTITQSGAGVTTGGTTVGFTTSSNGFAWRIE